ncbi:ATP-dependent helicase HrpA, partial [Cystobacter fuscus]|uniref:ATP-dependent helicase HrpA n=1 Tax=Cystobacter fuscus TaxID=43 RepID=UPI001FDF8EDE
VALEAETRKEARRERTARVDWAERLRRRFAVEVFARERSGGRRRVLAEVKGAAGERAMVEHLG